MHFTVDTIEAMKHYTIHDFITDVRCKFYVHFYVNLSSNFHRNKNAVL